MEPACRIRVLLLFVLAIPAHCSSCAPPNLIAKWLTRDSPECLDDCALTDYLNTFTNGMKLEGMVGGYWVYVFLNAVTMFAGIPSGTANGRWFKPLARFFHRTYQAFLVVQIINQIFPMLYFTLAFAATVKNHADCLVPFNGHSSMMSMVWVFSSAFHPFMLTSLGLILMFVTVLVQTERVSSIVKHGKDLDEFWTRTVGFDRFLPRVFWALYAWPAITLGLFLCTIAFLFALPFVGIEILVYVLVAGLCALMKRLYKWTEGSEKAWVQAVHAGTTAFGGAGNEEDGFDPASGGLFGSATFAPVGTFMASPFVLYGVVFAWSTYSSNYSSAQLNELIVDLYHHSFHVFIHAEFDFSAFFDINNIEAALKAMQAIYDDPFSLAPSPEKYVEAAQGHLLLGSLVSFFKLLLSAIVAVLAYAKVVAPNIPTNKVAGNDKFGEAGIKQVQEIIKKAEEKKKKKKKKKKKDVTLADQATDVRNPIPGALEVGVVV
eukprot:g1971.t1